MRVRSDDRGRAGAGQFVGQLQLIVIGTADVLGSPVQEHDDRLPAGGSGADVRDQSRIEGAGHPGAIGGGRPGLQGVVVHGSGRKIVTSAPRIVVRNGAIAWVSFAPMPITGKPDFPMAATVSSSPVRPY